MGREPELGGVTSAFGCFCQIVQGGGRKGTCMSLSCWALQWLSCLHIHSWVRPSGTEQSPVWVGPSVVQVGATSPQHTVPFVIPLEFPSFCCF